METMKLNNHINLPGEHCCGCEACVSVCPREAISMVVDSLGFRYATINSLKCVGCHLCEKTCPILNSSFHSDNISTIAGFANDPRIVEESSSGGYFTLIARKFIESGGYVVGVAWNSDFHGVHHTIVDELTNIHLIQKSKYVQSRKDLIYKECLALITQGKRVLFVGTPCEVAALKKIVGKQDENLLYTIDFVCQGPTSEKAIGEYFDCLERKYSSKICGVNMRLAIGPWIPQFLHVSFENKKAFIERLYETPLGDAIRIMQRPSCFQCKFVGNGRASDLTLGDYHGAKVNESYYNETGISILISHSVHGNEMISYLEGVAHVENTDYDELVKHNPCIEKHWPPREGYKDFTAAMKSGGLLQATKAVIPFKHRMMRRLPWRFREVIKTIKERIIH